MKAIKYLFICLGMAIFCGVSYANPLLHHWLVAMGDVRGNGGDAVVCRDAQNGILSVQTYDLFEAEAKNWGLII
ncbi:MAG: hypothetical protein AAB250_12465, partial [Bdellovibrionota bacterium]